ncbi:DEAD/DEAH box helicase [Salininema proteolyticum]|uniref:DEAD/DEAH box helicase n=1 Tax=Salininema proteolyticum TaxID=1607685 RepID=A0ABV8TSD9_9ACTN
MPSTPIDKAKFGSYARGVLDRAADAARRGRELAEARDRLGASMRGQVAALHRAELDAKLRGIGLDELRRLAPKGMRLGLLEESGYDTAASIHAATHRELTVIDGVGPQTAEAVKDAAAEIARHLAPETSLRLDPDRRDTAQTRLLATLAAERSASAAMEVAAAPLRRLEQALREHGPLAEPACSRMKMAFTRRRRAAATAEALAAIEEAVHGPEGAALEQALIEGEWNANPDVRSSGELWTAYEIDAASYNTAIANLAGVGGGAAPDDIDGDLRRQIDAVDFDSSLLTSELRGYQLFGAKYALERGRAIIGDEMGLGKTVQALAACAHLAAAGQRRFLVVCPASVHAGWIAEIRRHSRLEAHSLHGPDREEAAVRWLEEGGVAVTTFSTLRRFDLLTEEEVRPALLVVDEAHYVKNPESQRSQAVAALVERSRRTLFLTGTPLENRLDDFKNLIAYLDPATAEKLSRRSAFPKAKVFRRRVAPVYLRRNQEDVLRELPERIEVEDWVDLTAAQASDYRREVGASNLMGMRRASSAVAGSAKLERLRELVAEAGEDGRKVLVFSYFREVLDTLSETFGKAALGPVHGGVPTARRQELVDEFTARRGEAVLLAQIKAGGVGLNIQAASVVVICEPQWNPSLEEQAVARAHRMGQIRKVQVHRLLAKGSVDERIREVQERKRSVFDRYARPSQAKEADAMAVDGSVVRPAGLDDESVPLEQRIIVAERERLGL